MSCLDKEDWWIQRAVAANGCGRGGLLERICWEVSLKKNILKVKYNCSFNKIAEI